jgi:hypothetical protein
MGRLRGYLETSSLHSLDYGEMRIGEGDNHVTGFLTPLMMDGWGFEIMAHQGWTFLTSSIFIAIHRIKTWPGFID